MPNAPTLNITEKQLQANIVALAKMFGWLTYHTYDSRRSNRGFPDLFMVRGDAVVVVECKTERGKTTPYQDEWIAALATVPGVKWCGVLRPSGWFAGELDEVLR